MVYWYHQERTKGVPKMTINLPNITIDTTSIGTYYATPAEPFFAIEIPAGEYAYNEVVTASDLQTLWDVIESRRAWDNGEATWVIVFPTDQVAVTPGNDFPVEEYFPEWAKLCQLMAVSNGMTLDEYNKALRQAPLMLQR